MSTVAHYRERLDGHEFIAARRISRIPRDGHIGAAVTAIRQGSLVIIAQGAGRAYSAALVGASLRCSDESLAFVVRETAGIVCVVMLGTRLAALNLPPMVGSLDATNREEGKQFAVSVDATDGTTTGISAPDRARTIRALCSPCSGPGDFDRPGHIFPLEYRPGGVRRYPYHSEAVLELVWMAGLYPSGFYSEIVNHEGEIAPHSEVMELAQRYRLPVVSIDDLVAFKVISRRPGSVLGVPVA